MINQPYIKHKKGAINRSFFVFLLKPNPTLTDQIAPSLRRTRREKWAYKRKWSFPNAGLA